MLNLEIETVDFKAIKSQKLKDQVKDTLQEAYVIYKEKILKNFERKNGKNS